MKYTISGIIASIVVLTFGACGGGGGTDTNTTIVDNSGPKPLPVISNRIPKPTLNTFEVQENWQLSADGAPKYTLSTEGNISDFSQIVYTEHPRLYFRDTDESYLQAKRNTNAWTTFKNVVTTRLPENQNQDYTAGIAFLDIAEAGDAEYARMLAFMAHMERTPFYINLTIAWARHLAEMTPENSEGDILLRRRIERLSEIYDWLYTDLSNNDKILIRGALKRHVDQLMTFDYMQTTMNYIQKHSRWGHGVVAQALLVMYGDFDDNFTKVYADNLLSETREHLRKYQEAERYISSDGGWHLGWGYAYFNANYMFNYFIWSTATTETMLDDWMGHLTDWYLYALRADKTLPQTGDATVSSMGYGVMAALYQSKFKRDGFAKWYLDENEASFGDLFTRFILKDDTVVARMPSVLPTSRYFEQVGTVIARDTWDFENATLLIFKSSPFYNAGHHHRDENAFTIDYKTSLALDTGFYDLTDSPHYKNYYIRTLAHNAITVYNPTQKMRYVTDYNMAAPESEKELINDGGQVFKDPDSMSKADIVEGARNRLDGVVKYQRNDNYTYALGDATKAYDPVTVSLAQRAVMYVEDAGYKHPVIVVLDKIEATSGNYQKRYLLHTQPDAMPVITRDEMRVVSTGTKGAAQMINKTLFPQNADLVLVGGVGQEYRLMDGTNPNPISSDSVNEILNDNDTKTGTWRLEVSPRVGNNYDLMLNVIFVGDATENIETEKALLIGTATTDSIGIQLPKRVIVFSTDKKNAAKSMTYQVAKTSNIQHTVVTGFEAGTQAKVSVNGKTPTSFTVGEGGCVDFTLDANITDVIKVSQ